MLHRPAKVVDLPHEQDVELSLPSIVHEEIECRTGLFAARNATVEVSVHDETTTILSVIREFKNPHVHALLSS